MQTTIKRKFKNCFTMIPNTILNHKNLSLKSKGLCAYLLSKPDDWIFKKQVILSELKEGLDAFNSAIKELTESGFLSKTLIRDKNGYFIGTEYTIYDEPQINKPYIDEPSMENPSMENPTHYNNTNDNKTNNIKIKDNKEKNIKKEKTENDLTDILDEINNFDESIILHEPKLEKQLDKVFNDLKLSKIDYQTIFQDKTTQVLFLLCIRHKKTRTTKAIESDIEQLQQIPQDDLRDALQEWNNKKWLCFKSEYVVKKTQPTIYQKSFEAENKRKYRETMEAIFKIETEDNRTNTYQDINDFKDVTDDDDDDITQINSNDIPF